MCDLEVAITNGVSSLTAILTNGTAPFTYAWSTGDDTDVIRIAADGDYSVTVTDAEGCIVIAIISAVADPCNGFEGKISATRDDYRC